MPGLSRQTTLAACWGLYGGDVPEGGYTVDPVYPASPPTYSDSSSSSSSASDSDSSSTTELSSDTIVELTSESSGKEEEDEETCIAEPAVEPEAGKSETAQSEAALLSSTAGMETVVEYEVCMESAMAEPAEPERAEAAEPDTAPAAEPEMAGVESSVAAELDPAEACDDAAVSPSILESAGHTRLEDYNDGIVRVEKALLGWVTSPLISGVKTATLHMLRTTLTKYLEEICNGCRISHPSQRQHRCLMVREEQYFFSANFYEILERLLTPRFVPAIQNLLRSRGIEACDDGVKSVALTLLHGLRFVRDIDSTISDIYEGMNDGDLAEFKSMDIFYNSI